MSLQGKQLPSIALAVNAPAPLVPNQQQRVNQPVVKVTTTPGPTTATIGAGPVVQEAGQKQFFKGAWSGHEMQTFSALDEVPQHQPDTISYYSVKVDQVIKEHQTVFVPGRLYHVSPHIYFSKLEDGTTFASHCVQMLPQNKSE